VYDTSPPPPSPAQCAAQELTPEHPPLTAIQRGLQQSTPTPPLHFSLNQLRWLCGPRNALTMSDDESELPSCPLCMEELDATDKNFHPCPCGYQICAWCWHQRACPHPPHPPHRSRHPTVAAGRMKACTTWVNPEAAGLSIPVAGRCHSRHAHRPSALAGGISRRSTVALRTRLQADCLLGGDVGTASDWVWGRSLALPPPGEPGRTLRRQFECRGWAPAGMVSIPTGALVHTRHTRVLVVRAGGRHADLSGAATGRLQ
jgi:hypothetical protein